MRAVKGRIEVETEAPAQEVARLEIERSRLEGENLFRESAVANLEWTVNQARRLVDERFAPIIWLEQHGPEMIADRMAGLALIASEEFLQGQLQRIAGPPRPGVPSAQWSSLSKAETAMRIADIDTRLAELDIVLRVEAARQRAAAAEAEIERLERGEVEPEAAAEPADPEPERDLTPAEALVARKAAQEAHAAAQRVRAEQAPDDQDSDLGWKGP